MDLKKQKTSPPPKKKKKIGENLRRPKILRRGGRKVARVGGEEGPLFWSAGGGGGQLRQDMPCGHLCLTEQNSGKVEIAKYRAVWSRVSAHLAVFWCTFSCFH